MLTPQQSTGPNKRHWPNNGDVMNTQLNMNQLHPSKRSCMMTSFMEAANSDDHQWIMDPSMDSTGYDFHMNDANDVNKRNNGSTWNGMMNGLACDNDCESENVLLGDMDQKKQTCFNSMSVKANDLMEREVDLLGLSASSSTTLDNTNAVLMQQLQQQQQNHMHAENSVYASNIDNADSSGVGTQSNAVTNNSSNSMEPSFDDDINQHVQNAIDSILNLQNSENESLHYLDQTMGSFLADSPLTPSNLIHHQQASTTNDFHFSPSQASHQNSPFLS